MVSQLSVCLSTRGRQYTSLWPLILCWGWEVHPGTHAARGITLRQDEGYLHPGGQGVPFPDRTEGILLLQPPGGRRVKRMVVPDLENRTIETMKAEHAVLLRKEDCSFIGWHVTNQETARALVRGGRYVPPERTGSALTGHCSIFDSKLKC